jgi:RNA polymerase sigma factor (sigma-70 family)
VTQTISEVVAAVGRIESPRLIAATSRIVRDVGVAEDLVQDALLAALEQWPTAGVPDRPGAWLQAAARHRAIDYVRRRAAFEAKQYQLVREYEADQGRQDAEQQAIIEERLGDDLLELVFVCCHPVLPRPTRIAVTLRLIGALTTTEIASAFLVPEPTVAQRIVRGKKALASANVQFELPVGEELQKRVPAVLEVIYLIFNEGYSASVGEAWTRPALCEDALRLVRMVAARSEGVAEVHGLAALLELQASRLAARFGADGEPVLLEEQDRSRWNRILISRGMAALGVASRARGDAPPGPYELQAQIAACHASARNADGTDWVRIAALYAALELRAPSPVVELNRAVAVGRAFGPAAGLELVDAIRDDPTLASYHLLPSVRADLLDKLGRPEEARAELVRAAQLTANEDSRRLLEARLPQEQRP